MYADGFMALGLNECGANVYEAWFTCMSDVMMGLALEHDAFGNPFGVVTFVVFQSGSPVLRQYPQSGVANASKRLG